MSLSALNGKNGFRLDGVEAGDESGCSVASAGDINGDGYDDVLVGARGANGEAGATYVVYGKQKGFDAAISLADLDGGDGFRIDGIDAGDASGFSVASAGDVNGDGYADLMIGAPVSGDAYVIYGGNFTGAVDFVGSGGDDLLDYGSDAGESFVAGRGNDTMVGGGGRDVYRGGAGDDRIVIGDADFLKVDGGGNEDTLAVSGELDLDLTEILNTRITGIEIIDLVAGAGENDLNLTKLDLFALSNTNANVITVNGDASDSVTIDGLWAEAPELDGGYRVFTSGAATLRVQSQIDILGIDVIT